MTERAAGLGRTGCADSDHPACGRKDQYRIYIGIQREGAVLTMEEKQHNRLGEDLGPDWAWLPTRPPWRERDGLPSR